MSITAQELRTQAALQAAYAAMQQRAAAGMNTASVWNLTTEAITELRSKGFRLEKVTDRNYVMSF